jgi:hypothetical protein
LVANVATRREIESLAAIVGPSDEKEEVGKNPFGLFYYLYCFIFSCFLFYFSRSVIFSKASLSLQHTIKVSGEDVD